MEYYLIVSAIMFFAGIYGFFTRRNTLAILISIELILNATDIPRRTGRIFLLFILHRHLGGRNGCSHCHHD